MIKKVVLFVVALGLLFSPEIVSAQCEGGVCRRPVRNAVSQVVQTREGVTTSRQVRTPVRNSVRYVRANKPVRRGVVKVAQRARNRVRQVVRVVTFPGRVLFRGCR